jgi:uncharacterized protein YecT (DUF1311 family)
MITCPHNNTVRFRARLFVAAIAAAFAAAGPAHSEISDASPVVEECIKRSEGVTPEMRTCLADEYKRLDRILNATYRSVMKQLKTKDHKRRLVESQRVWLRLRDERCRLKVEQSGMEGGQGGDLIYDGCHVTLLRKRIMWLRKVPDNPGYLSKV